MSNKLIQISKKTPLPYYCIGVLNTPMYPASYYAGYILKDDDEYIIVDNSVSNFHRSCDEAEQAASALALRDGSH